MALIDTPWVAVLRSVMLNHWYHPRGQLTLYLRELDVLRTNCRHDEARANSGAPLVAPGRP
jgi:hypothetical protein